MSLSTQVHPTPLPFLPYSPMPSYIASMVEQFGTLSIPLNALSGPTGSALAFHGLTGSAKSHL